MNLKKKEQMKDVHKFHRMYKIPEKEVLNKMNSNTKEQMEDILTDLSVELLFAIETGNRETNINVGVQILQTISKFKEKL